ncbi:hypothetical protein ACFVOB_22085 [Streptomyces rochei]|uniref:hypothetical protein n=1 Tax=Streptomyces rochei TaxID=1928 RepID=UPI00369F2F36
MTDRPYTDDDLRAEAARQHDQILDEALEFAGVGESMQDAYVGSTLQGDEGSTWGEAVDGEAFGEAQEKIHALIRGAADVSEWAVNLGADGLQPDGHTLQLGTKGPAEEDPDQPFVRLHFAFRPDAPAEDRDRFVMELSKVVLRNL